MKRAALINLSFFTVLSATVPVTALSQTIYRCGASYSQTPCEGAVQVNVDDARSAAQKAESQKTIAKDGRIADAMEKARLKQEKERAVYDAKLRQAEEDAGKKALAAQKKASATANAPKKSASAPNDGKGAVEPFVAKSTNSGK